MGPAKDWLRTAGEYGLIHALAVFAAVMLIREGSRAAGIAAWLFLAGAAIFSGSLDVMALTGQLWARREDADRGTVAASRLGHTGLRRL